VNEKKKIATIKTAEDTSDQGYNIHLRNKQCRPPQGIQFQYKIPSERIPGQNDFRSERNSGSQQYEIRFRSDGISF